MGTVFEIGAERIAIKDLEKLKDNAPEIIVWALPGILFFVLLEAYFSYKQNKPYYNRAETIGSIGVGLGNLIMSFWIKLFLFYIAVHVYNWLPWRLSFSWWTLVPSYIVFDFCSYWAHRISHHQRFWWATHVAHHSGQYYNLTVSFRLSWIQYFKIVFLFPVFLLGFHPVIFFVTNQIAILFQFWVHTQYIGKLPAFIEYIFATPSNHRVHHSSQPQYINKNFGATFIIWDRIFGTYEKESGPITYGITENIGHTTNPLYINFHEIVAIIKDVKRAHNLREVMHYIFGDPGVIAHEKNLHQSIKVQSQTVNHVNKKTRDTTKLGVFPRIFTLRKQNGILRLFKIKPKSFGSL